MTKQLEGYLKKEYSLDLPTLRTYYALIPATQCPSCVNFRADSFRQETLDQVVIVSGFDRKHFDGFKHYYFDSDNSLERIKFLDYNSKIVVVEDRKVISVLSLTNLYLQVDSLEKQVNK